MKKLHYYYVICIVINFYICSMCGMSKYTNRFKRPCRRTIATTAQTWNGTALGNFVFNAKQPYRAHCTIQDYLCKYIAKDLHIAEEEVPTKAQFHDIKKSYELFMKHNHPEAILKDFEDKLITKQHAKDALEFTYWVTDALERYLKNVNDDMYKKDLFELSWQINRMKENSAGMRFVEKGEWRSTTRE
jgi:hypothetical protein